MLLICQCLQNNDGLTRLAYYILLKRAKGNSG